MRFIASTQELRPCTPAPATPTLRSVVRPLAPTQGLRPRATPTLPSVVRPLVLLFALLFLACSRPPPDGTPEGVVRLWLEKMETAEGDARAMKEAYGLLGPHARANLKERADRASRGQGRRYEPYEMLAEGRFGLRFRPRAMTTHIDGDEAVVDVNGEGADEHAQVKCTREAQLWRIEPELPDVVTPTRHLDGGS